jgi:hypothetical protein
MKKIMLRYDCQSNICHNVAVQLEVTIGRIAMLGFTGLILNEAFFGKPFFPHLF